MEPAPSDVRIPPARAGVRVPALARVSAMVVALGAGYVGQHRLDRPPVPPWGWALLLGGALGFGLLAGAEALEQARRGPAVASRAPRLALLALALGLGALAFAGLGDNRFHPLPALAWLGAIVALFLTFREASVADERRRALALEQGVCLSWQVLTLLAIVLVGAFLRFYRLDALPREMGTDMPLKYDNALEIMQGQFMIFCPRYPGREALFFYLVAAYGKIFGLGFFAIKFVCALLGVATIPVLYALGRTLFDRRVGLVAAAFLAVSKWHVILSRTGYRSIMVPLFLAGLAWLVVRALRSGRASDFCLAGMALGLGMYTYSSFLVVPPVLALALLLELALRGRQAFRRYGWGLGALALGALLMLVPLGRYALDSPQSYLFRVATRMTSLEVPLPRDVVRVLLSNVWRAAGMFNLRGDGMFYVNVPYQRQLGAVSAVLFLAGLAYALWRWRHGHNALLLLLLGGMILPTALAVAFPQEVPSAGRVSGLLAPVCLLVALPLVLLGQRIGSLWQGAIRQPWQATLLAPLGRNWRLGGQIVLPSGGALAAVGLVALLGVELNETRLAYFRDYAARLPGQNYAISLELARALDDYAGEGQAYIVYQPYWYDGNALRVQLQRVPRTWDGELTGLDAGKPPLATATGRMMFILHPDDRKSLQLLESLFPRGIAVRHRDAQGEATFVVFYGER